MEIEILATVISVMAILISFITVTLSKLPIGKSYATSSLQADKFSKIEDAVRLNEARNVIHALEKSERVLKVANISLLTGQFVVGSLLTSSFAHEHLSPVLLGIIGIVVLVATVINQTFRPNTLLIMTQKKVIQLRRSIREVEDKLFDLENNPDEEHSIHSIRSFMTEQLNEIERINILEKSSFSVKKKG